MTPARHEATALLALLRRERTALAEFLAALADFDKRRAWVELGHASLFAFLVKDLGLSSGAAAYRKAAVDLVQRVPRTLDHLRTGELCLTTVFEVAKVLTPGNAAEVLPRFFGASKREAQQAVAELAPAPAPVRTVVTALRLRGPAVADRVPRSDDWPADLVHANPSAPPHQGAHPGCTSPAASSAFAPSAPVAGALTPAALRSDVQAPTAPRALTAQALAPRTVVEPRSAELTRVHLTVPRRLLGKLAAAKDALSHSHRNATDADVLEVALDLVIARHRKRRGIGAKPRKSTPLAAASADLAEAATRSPLPSPSTTPEAAAAVPTSRSTPAATARSTSSPTAPAESDAEAVPSVSTPAPAGRVADPAADFATPPTPPRPKRSRQVPAHVWRAVWARDAGRCVWPLAGGGVCGETRRLQLDHVHGFALGAETTVDACRLLCALHQDVSARQLFGDETMNAYTRPKTPRCSEPVVTWARTASP